MEVPITLRFARAARLLASEARRLGLAPPSFRSPPRVDGADRTIRRLRSGPMVSIRLRNRPFAAIAADMVDGVLAANGVPPGPDADRARHALLAAIGAEATTVEAA